MKSYRAGLLVHVDFVRVLEQALRVRIDRDLLFIFFADRNERQNKILDEDFEIRDGLYWSSVREDFVILDILDELWVRFAIIHP